MVKHIVMWKLVENSEGKTKSENILAMRSCLEGLKEKIEVIQALEVGVNFNQSDHAFDIVLVTEFADRQALSVYQDHPEHIKAKEFIQKLRSHVYAVDYEVS